MTKRPWKKRLAAAVLAPVLLLLAAEIAFRVALFSPVIQPHPCSPTPSLPQYLFLPDPDADYALRPYFQGRETDPDHLTSFPIIVNALGFRGPQLKAEVCEDCQRVLFLGDSFTFGEGVKYEDSFAAKVEAALNQEGRQAQVFDAGVPAYSLSQMQARLPRQLALTRPRLVVLCWLPWTFAREEPTGRLAYLNGFLVEPALRSYLHVAGDNIFKSPFPPGSLRLRADLWSQSHSFVYYYIKYKVPFYIHRHFAVQVLTRKEFNLPPIYLKKSMDLVAAMSQTSRDHGADFALVLLTSNPETTAPIAEYCRQQQIPLLSLAERTYVPNGPYLHITFKYDQHFNPTGHATVAPDLAAFVTHRLDQRP
jgi:hypothetical protein